MVKHLLTIALALCITTAELDQLIEYLRAEAWQSDGNTVKQQVHKSRAQSLRDAADEIEKKDTDRLLVKELLKRYRQHGVCK